MSLEFKEYVTKSNEIILYVGSPNFEKIEELSLSYGDIWHSSFEQAYKNAFLDIVYQTIVFFWYVNDFDNLNECISWRLNPNHFAIRKSVWEKLGGFDKEYENKQLQALDFAYNALRNCGAVPMYIKDLYTVTDKEKIEISTKDRYVFYRKNFKLDHSLFMLYRKGFWKLSEWSALFYAKKKFKQRGKLPVIAPRKLKEVEGKQKVSYIIPTILRQDFI